MPRTARGTTLSAALLAVAVFAAGCASTPPTSGSDWPAGSTPATTDATPLDDISGDLVVFAAASLGSAFDEIATAFEAAHPNLDVQAIRYDGSSTLATQLLEGAVADVFASADEKNMAKVTDAGLATGPQLFATNTLVIATPESNPADITSLADLGRADTTVVLCAVEVPCGDASRNLLDAAGITIEPASFEQNVTAVLTKVEEGEADAGLVYATDVIDRPVVSIVPEGAADVVNRYPIAALNGAANPDAAAAFVAFVLDAKGAAILAAHGFGAP